MANKDLKNLEEKLKELDTIEKGKATAENLKDARKVLKSAKEEGVAEDKLAELEEKIAKLSADAIEADDFQGENLEVSAEDAIEEEKEEIEKIAAAKEDFINSIKKTLRTKLGIENDEDLPMIEVPSLEIEDGSIGYSYNIRFNDNHMVGDSSTTWSE